MSWQARIEHTPAGLALTFGAPTSRLDMAPDVAQHLASLLAVEARHRMRGVVGALVEQPNPNDIQLIAAGGAHALQCDCDFCLNGKQP